MLEQNIETLTQEIKALTAEVKILAVVVTALAKVTNQQQAPEAEKPKRRRSAPVDPNAETEALPRPESAVEPKPAVEPKAEPAPAPAPAEVKPTPTREELIAKFQGLVAKFGKEKATEMARNIINGLGAANVSGIPEDKRAAALAAVEDALVSG